MLEVITKEVFDNAIVYYTKWGLLHVSQQRQGSATVRGRARRDESHRPKASMQPLVKKRLKTQGKCIHSRAMIYE
jgi:hypothetical protein